MRGRCESLWHSVARLCSLASQRHPPNYSGLRTGCTSEWMPHAGHLCCRLRRCPSLPNCSSSRRRGPAVPCEQSCLQSSTSPPCRPHRLIPAKRCPRRHDHYHHSTQASTATPTVPSAWLGPKRRSVWHPWGNVCLKGSVHSHSGRSTPPYERKILSCRRRSSAACSTPGTSSILAPACIRTGPMISPSNTDPSPSPPSPAALPPCECGRWWCCGCGR